MTRVQLHPWNAGLPALPGAYNRWCGPGALSILTGLSTGAAAAVFRRVTQRRNITGVTTGDMRAALRRCGIESTLVYTAPRKAPTLNQFFSSFEWKAGVVYLVVAGNHFQLVQNRMFVDNQVKEPVCFEDLKSGKRRRMEKVFALSPL